MQLDPSLNGKVLSLVRLTVMQENAIFAPRDLCSVEFTSLPQSFRTNHIINSQLKKKKKWVEGLQRWYSLLSLHLKSGPHRKVKRGRKGQHPAIVDRYIGTELSTSNLQANPDALPTYMLPKRKAWSTGTISICCLSAVSQLARIGSDAIALTEKRVPAPTCESSFSGLPQ